MDGTHGITTKARYMCLDELQSPLLISQGQISLTNAVAKCKHVESVVDGDDDDGFGHVDGLLDEPSWI